MCASKIQYQIVSARSLKTGKKGTKLYFARPYLCLWYDYKTDVFLVGVHGDLRILYDWMATENLKSLLYRELSSAWTVCRSVFSVHCLQWVFRSSVSTQWLGDIFCCGRQVYRPSSSGCEYQIKYYRRVEYTASVHPCWSSVCRTDLSLRECGTQCYRPSVWG